MKLFLLLVVLLGNIFLISQAVDRSKFRTCADTGFCRKYRGLEREHKDVVSSFNSFHNSFNFCFSFVLNQV